MFRSCKVGSYNVYKIYKRKKYIFCFPANGWPNSNVNVQGPFNMILWLRKILFITRNIWGNKCMTYFKGPCTKFEVELMSFFIHFGWFNICSTSNFVQSPFKWLQFINAIYTSIYLFNIQNNCILIDCFFAIHIICTFLMYWFEHKNYH